MGDVMVLMQKFSSSRPVYRKLVETNEPQTSLEFFALHPPHSFLPALARTLISQRAYWPLETTTTFTKLPQAMLWQSPQKQM